MAGSHLATRPYRHCKVGPRPTLRELIEQFGATGQAPRFEFRSPELVLVIGARQQREEDFQ
jgi:hypothetical protein